MKHSNPNAIAPTLRGIETGEKLVGEAGEQVVDALVADLDRLHDELASRRTGRFIPAMEQAFAQGAVGAWLSAQLRADREAEVRQRIVHGATFDDVFVDGDTSVTERSFEQTMCPDEESFRKG